MTPILTTTDLLLTLDLAAREHILADSIKAELDAALSAAHAKYDAKVKAHADAEMSYLKLAQKYANEHRKDLLTAGKKSLTLGAHELGWEDNGGGVKLRKGLTEKKALEKLLKQGGRLAKLFTKMTPKLDKTAIADKWPAFGSSLKKLGIHYQHEEHFFVRLGLTKKPEGSSEHE
jgi:phage host-nuclease inhibitor protein Gam